jgi:prefoldin subunit 5
VNYIQKLQARIADLQAEKNTIADAIDALRVYLTSDKFRNDTTVQAQDVLNRLPTVYKD